MLDANDRRFLFEAMERNSVVLFLGAGFSSSAINLAGNPIPTGAILARDLWAWMDYPGEYAGNGSDLGEIFEACLNSGRPLKDLRSILEQLLITSEMPEWYVVLTKVFWYRIYGTNVDDVLEKAFEASQLDRVVAPRNDYRERDQFLRQTQYIKLNGSLPGDPRQLTFSPRQYARRSAEHDTWYDHFIRDYVFHPTIFVGTELQEPLFWQAIVEREQRGQNPEERPRSFLVAPSVQPPRLSTLASLNIRHISATAEDFFTWLNDEYSFPSQSETLRLVVPEAVEVLDLFASVPGVKEALPEFLSVFPRVPIPTLRSDHPKTYFLGAPPTWQDVAADFDAPRECTAELLEITQEAFAKTAELRLVAVLGAGGSGKSSLLKRIALSLRQSGKQVFYAEGYERPRVADVVTALQAFPEKVYLFIDNAQLMGRRLVELVEALSAESPPPTMVIGSRYNLFERELRELVGKPGLTIFNMPNLTNADIESLVATLEKHRQLGVLEPMSDDERYYEFKVRAGKQILVAMREATRGKGFDDILRSEFGDLEVAEARILYLCAALASAELMDLSQGQWIACAAVSPSDALTLLSRNLKGLLHQSHGSERIVARHPVIAQYILDHVATRAELLIAYKRLLSTLAHDIYGGRGRGKRSWRLFVRLINHASIFDRFTENIDMARSIYDSVSDWFRTDGFFWLQYANLEIEYGEPQYARPHVAHAEGVMPDHDQVLTTKAHLSLRESLTATSLEEATALRLEAEQILDDQLRRIGDDDEYPFHVSLTQRLAWIRRWGPLMKAEQVRDYLEALDDLAADAKDAHPTSRRLQEVASVVRKEYLQTAVPPNEK